ncbi:fumarylacetoacetate hydrolase family protein [Corynebacterium sp. CCM 9185]|uniref:Fumarylacetoacetate hydrolase family protein n=1 Tax=Corynebacterium marambiense TaxID=2765364 RepID=A0ABS0W1L6_9CORY|nr:fumarylacetoacetate hydrolase family protein [Corynebacterium marambiense]MBI9001548.1 fumarylacetoacetate hydrolase family protein [Corynebacterium marambiense]MCK7663929.1 fumarylacetoacetate hydrolase family protein [Corynebacterium marambiense]MCX7543263.1 fumarylacetoacetate hydrolase family protein [Corynebacterium marambiense]
MQLLTFRTDGGTLPGCVADPASAEATLTEALRSGDAASAVFSVRPITLPGALNVGDLLRHHNWRELASARSGEPVEITGSDIAPVIPRPGKILCTGLNYADHITEMGHDLPDVPTLFAKFPDALTGPFDRVTVPTENAKALDFEGELAVVIGRHVPLGGAPDTGTAEDAIAGYAVFNDFTMRDLQYRTAQWLQGKNLVSASGFGPWLTTSDAFTPGEATLVTRVNDVEKQHADIRELVFDPVALVQFITTFIDLHPGDVIATGTSGGVGWARSPREMLTDGDTVTIEISGLGGISNRIVVC